MRFCIKLNSIINISGYIWSGSWYLAFSIVFFYFYILIYISYKISSELIFIGDNFCHNDKISSLLNKELLTDEVFRYCYTKSLLCWFVNLYCLVTKNYCYSLFFLLDAFLSRCDCLLIDTLLRILSLKFIWRSIFPDLNDNIWKVKKLNFWWMHKFDIIVIFYRFWSLFLFGSEEVLNFQPCKLYSAYRMLSLT